MQPSLGLINGIYDIACPVLQENFDSQNLTLILTLDTLNIWGAYDFGAFSRILHIPNRPFTASPRPLSFQWRGRENSEGEMQFGEYCQGAISFLGDGRLEGWLNVSGECHSQGWRCNGPGTPIRRREEYAG